MILYLLRTVTKAIAGSLFFAAILTGLFLLHIPVDEWELFTSPFFHTMPFLVLLIGVSIGFGLIKGLLDSFRHQAEWQGLAQALTDLENGQTPHYRSSSKNRAYVKQIMGSLTHIHQQLKEQTKRAQDLISQRVEDQEEAIEKRITAERNRLARELHDSVSQELFAASMLVSAINEMPDTDDSTIQKPIQQVEQMIQQAQLEMRALLLHLRPVALKDHSLKEGVESLLKDLSEKVPVTVQWRIEDVDVKRGIEDHLFRILQESVSNTLRHAKATTLDIMLIEREGQVILTVVDDGIGFEVSDQSLSSYGLSNMHERTAEIGGTLRIISVPGEGTKLDVKVPIIKE
ncbi:sensor histidine kinase [Halolactibacillus alkaliphilus]|uniref:Sensor histidine kinase n=1 Tax=Halolactibacillus alkaliphilus TaxID=442899 RepID=A0A511WYJ5_9BACI|nr:sensor histidine kinase [Halolactibacillus alkaliphilus]GEN55558.1 sensor histidine kinase [Halolactibacillus alkaliphilus]GGN64030.1 sensor histidine kinase [Halolactibacillus alkaliphilus]SFO61979.1 two-component system, NarL family, sensor histidine kinase LiaS [Halolactibacillus alkaliphilus]